MLKKIVPVIIIIILLIAGFVYYSTTNKQENQSAQSQTNTSTDSQLTSLPEGWQTYTSPEWGFSINHPADVKTELTQNGVHFMKLGETQTTGTELYDGLSLLVFTAKLNNISFEAFAQQEYDKVKNEPIIESISQLEDVQITSYAGYKFTSSGIGKSTTYFLNDANGGYIKITDMTVEPSTATRDFHQTVSQMLNTFQLTQTNPAGGSEIEAVTAVKAFAAQDLNTALTEIQISSTKPNEWNNACMGLEQPGEMCAEVITPGYIIVVEASGKQRIYHTNNDGSIIKIKQ